MVKEVKILEIFRLKPSKLKLCIESSPYLAFASKLFWLYLKVTPSIGIGNNHRKTCKQSLIVISLRNWRSLFSEKGEKTGFFFILSSFIFFNCLFCFFFPPTHCEKEAKVASQFRTQNSFDESFSHEEDLLIFLGTFDAFSSGIRLPDSSSTLTIFWLHFITLDGVGNWHIGNFQDFG